MQWSVGGLTRCLSLSAMVEMRPTPEPPGTNHGDECDLPPTIRTPYIFGKAVLLVRNV
jgi:hypothetical protein